MLKGTQRFYRTIRYSVVHGLMTVRHLSHSSDTDNDGVAFCKGVRRDSGRQQHDHPLADLAESAVVVQWAHPRNQSNALSLTPL